MKKIFQQLSLFAVIILFAGYAGLAQTATDPAKTTKPVMKTFVIERNIPGAGQFTPEKLKSIAKTSCGVLREMGPGIQWINSYVTENKIICIYKAENIDMIKEHAKEGGFPANVIYEVDTEISPATAN